MPWQAQLHRCMKSAATTMYHTYHILENNSKPSGPPGRFCFILLFFSFLVERYVYVYDVENQSLDISVITKKAESMHMHSLSIAAITN
jgi:hypothetical protein